MKRLALLLCATLVACASVYARYAETTWVNIYRFNVFVPKLGEHGRARIGAMKIETKHGATLKKLRVTTSTDRNSDGDFNDAGEVDVKFDAPPGGTDATLADIEWDTGGNMTEVRVEISVEQNGVEHVTVDETFRNF